MRVLDLLPTVFGREFQKALAGEAHCLRPSELEECLRRYEVIPAKVIENTFLPSAGGTMDCNNDGTPLPPPPRPPSCIFRDV